MEEWNDYADKGKGVCIEYKFKTLYNQAFIGFKVNYDPDMKPLNYFDKNGKLDTVSLHRWLFTKRISYTEEDEVRLVCKLGFFGVFQPNIDVFNGLYYGNNTSAADIEILERLLKDGGYSFDKGVKANY